MKESDEFRALKREADRLSERYFRDLRPLSEKQRQLEADLKKITYLARNTESLKAFIVNRKRSAVELSSSDIIEIERSEETIKNNGILLSKFPSRDGLEAQLVEIKSEIQDLNDKKDDAHRAADECLRKQKDATHLPRPKIENVGTFKAADQAEPQQDAPKKETPSFELELKKMELEREKNQLESAYREAQAEREHETAKLQRQFDHEREMKVIEHEIARENRLAAEAAAKVAATAHEQSSQSIDSLLKGLQGNGET